MKASPSLTLLTGVAVSVLLLSGCSSPAATPGSDGTPQMGGDLVMARADPAETLVPNLATSNAAIWTMEEMYDTMLLPSVDGEDVVPALATDWTQSEDGLSWTFNLRTDVVFSDGQALTSRDVKFSLEEASKPEMPFSFINSSIASVAAPDDFTVVVTTEQPFAPLPSVMAIFSNSIIPFNYGGVTAEEFAAHPIGSGPFMLDHWTEGGEIKLVKNPEYWQAGKPYLDSVTFSLVSDANTRANQVQGGQAQINEFPAYSSLAGLEGQSGVAVGIFPSSRVEFLTLNNVREPFTDVHVRRALAYAVDKASIVKAVLFGNGEPAGAYMAPSSWSHNAAIEGLPFDLDKAKAELAQSSQPNGFTATITVTSGNPEENAMAQIVQAAAAQIGITLNIVSLDPSALGTALYDGNFDMAFLYDTTDIVDPDEIIRFTGVYDGGSFALLSYYDNPEIAALAEKAVTLRDQAERKVIYDQIQVMWDDDQPMVPLYYSPNVYSFSTKVQGFQASVTGNYNLVNVWLAP